MPRLFTLLLITSVVVPPWLQASEPSWPQWRGPAMAGIADDDRALPEEWSASTNLAWKNLGGAALWSRRIEPRLDRWGGARVPRRPSSTTSIVVLDNDSASEIIAAGPKYKLLGKHPLEEMTLASPAIASGHVIIRTATHLYAFKR